MEKRVTYKDVEIGGRNWRIGKFDALTGSYIAYKVMTQILPTINGGVTTPEAMAEGLRASRASISKADFVELQRDCLGVCSELQNVGGNIAPVKVILTNGNWGVEGIETDVPTVMALTVHALFFNVSSFFDSNALDGAMGSFKGLNFGSAKE